MSLHMNVSAKDPDSICTVIHYALFIPKIVNCSELMQSQTSEAIYQGLLFCAFDGYI